MAILLGQNVPDFTAETTEGMIRFHEWIGFSWCLFFSHPKDFTPVCTTELGTVARLMPEFNKRDVKVMGISVDPLDAHHRWADDIKETQGVSLNYPLIADTKLKVAKLFGMLPDNAGYSSDGRTAADNQTVRSVFLIAPDKTVKLMITYPMSTGRNFEEILRVIDSVQLTANHKVATPADWKQGEDVIILPAITDDAAKELFPNGWKAPKPYLRVVPQPESAS